MKTKHEIEFINADQIEVLPWAERAPHPKDKELEASIRKGGIQEPLVVVRENGRTLLVKGSRRLRIGKRLGIPRFRCVVDPIPDGMNAEEYIGDVRFALAEHRQGLPPSVEAGFLQTLKERFGFNNLQLARYRGVDADTITNYMDVNGYIQPVKDALDAGEVTMAAARVFNGLSQLGQERIWKKHRRELTTSAVDRRALRAQYPPNVYPAFYVNPEKAQKRLETSPKAKKRRARVTYSDDEKKRLLSSLDFDELELAELQEEAQAIKARCLKAIKPINAILRTKKVRALLSDDERQQFERFAEVY